MGATLEHVLRLVDITHVVSTVPEVIANQVFVVSIAASHTRSNRTGRTGAHVS